ncbi:hypothetical protein [Kitasatospora xanthocidica]|uniref:hypothetical protein n=1 Tax=Kitasatospora xanthocidica TaxID=83382 RepID=UPI0015F34D45|nr:hypothetical protein [Kitasatospora xanthocidica]
MTTHDNTQSPSGMRAADHSRLAIAPWPPCPDEGLPGPTCTPDHAPIGNPEN